MKINPTTNDSLVLRTDFSDENAWQKVCQLITAPQTSFGFVAQVEFYNDVVFSQATVQQIMASLPTNRNYWFLLVVDNETITHPDHPVLCIDLLKNPGATFRVMASQVVTIESNLAAQNMDFAAFAKAVDADGIFRGYQEVDS